MPKRLTDEEIEHGLKELNGWSRKNDEIEREFEFKDFAQALEFVNSVGAEAERLDHHPDILLHSWNKVKINLTTHSEKGLTNNDIELARRLDLIQS